MFFYNARLVFKIPELQTPIEGSIIAASAIAPVDLQRRPFEDHPHLERRFLDPQLYMASVDPALDRKTVDKLAAYPWFHGHPVPKYDSGKYSSRKAWKTKHVDNLAAKWTRAVLTEPSEIRSAARAAVEFQVGLGCEGILLPAPLTTIVDQTLEAEMNWLDAGLLACSALKVKQPIFATIALSEAVLHVPALKNPLLHSLSNAVSSRPELAGAYIVLEQSDPGNYFWKAKDALMSLLVLVDDLHRGAKKKVVVNYVGTFGLVARTVGAEIWSSGYYLMQRRFSLMATGGRARPRYHSLALAGDVGLKEDLARIQSAGLAEKVMTPTKADAVLRSALKKGKTPADVAEWKYAQGNITAARHHYLEIASNVASQLQGMKPAKRVEWTEAWLKNAVELASDLKKKSLVDASDVDHQKVWLDVFTDWRNYAKQ